MHNQTVKNVRLYHETNGSFDEYFLDVTLIVENDRYTKEITIPKIRIPLYDAYVEKYTHSYKESPIQYTAKLILPGRGALDVYPDYHGSLFYERIVDEKVHEMTISEIEAKLGYKVKVVAEKGES